VRRTQFIWIYARPCLNCQTNSISWRLGLERNSEQTSYPHEYSWPQYRLYVVKELGRMANVLTAMDARLDAIERYHHQEVGRKRAMRAISAAFGAGAAVVVELLAKIFLHQ